MQYFLQNRAYLLHKYQFYRLEGCKMLRKILILSIISLFPSFAMAQCLAVKDDIELEITQETLEKLKPINFGRNEIFQALANTSEYETLGCWAAPVGNFDAQTLSVGVLQWNYGQNSLQNLMNSYRNKFNNADEFSNEIKNLMPLYGETAFSSDCLAIPFKTECKDKILAAHDEKGKLNPNIQKEYEALFNSKIMRQVQLEEFSNFLINLSPKFTEIFGETTTPLKVRWGIDLAIQQGFVKYGENQSGFLNPQDVTNIRKLYESLDKKTKTNRMLSVIGWYSGLCGGIYQGVKTEQCNYNISHWCAVAVKGVTDEQFDLFNLTYVRSRIAQGQSGRWQANAFARRIKIVLETGQVGPNMLPLPKGVKKTRKCNKFLLEN